MHSYASTLEQSLPAVRGSIAAAADRVGRDPASIRLIAVTKDHPVEVVNAAVGAGLSDLGENRAEGLESRFEALRSRGEDPRAPGGRPVVWHMIGQIQSRKASRVVPMADWIHSVDRMKLARKLSETSVGESERPCRILVQVNTSGEDSKTGLPPEAVLQTVRDMSALPGLAVEGFMTMAPFTDEETVLRDTFRRLREIRDETCSRTGCGGELSMGMSNDFEIAIEEGSTMIRLGTILFGRRPT